MTAIIQDHHGRLLIGTKSGIVTFDGFAFEQYPFLKDAWIYCLLLETDGTLWAGTYKDGLYRIRNGQVSKIETGTVFSLIHDKHGRVWAVSEYSLGFIENDQFRTVVHGTNTQGFGWQSVTQEENGTLWLATQSGLFRYRANHAERISVIGLDGSPVTVYSAPQSHELFVGTTKKLYLLACAGDSCVSSSIKGIPGPIVGIHQTIDKTLWISTWGHGLYRRYTLNGNGHVEHIDHRSELTDDFVHATYEDEEHNLWIGTRSGGLTRFRTTLLKPFGVPEGVTGNCASAVTGDGAGGVWLGTWRTGLFHWSDGKIQQQTLPEQGLNTLITSLKLDFAHNLWIGTFKGLFVLRHDQQTIRLAFVFPPGFSEDASIRQIFFAADKSLWLLDYSGHLQVFRSGDPSTSHWLPVLAHEHVTYITQSADGKLWIGSMSGLWQMATPHSAPFQVFSSKSPIISISKDRHERLWVTFRDGSIRVQTKNGFVPFQRPAFPGKWIYGITEDTDGNFWFSTSLGLARAAGSQIDLALQNPGIRVDAIPLGIGDGARTIECRCVDYPQSWAAPDGTLWSPTAKGFIQMDPRRIGDLPTPIASVKWMKRDRVLLSRSDQAILPAGSHDLEISFASVRLGAPGQVRFHYRLEGVDSAWVEAGQDRIARYTQLSPGHYRFMVAARDEFGNWGPNAVVIVQKDPAYFQTAWFKGMIAALIFLILSAIYFAHLRSVRARYLAVLGERSRIAREWHDTLLSGLTAIAWQFDAALRTCTQPTLLTNLKNIRGMLRYCSDEARRAVSDLRDISLSPPDLTMMLREGLEHLTVDERTHFELDVDPSFPQLSNELSMHLLRISQEAVTNAIQHGKPSKIRVTLSADNGTVLLKVYDNGVGMSPSQMQSPPPGHFGILGIRERVDQIGGRLGISATPGHGTTITVEMPVSI
ncbi:MAG: hypothetical protein JSS95_16260 [Acidobacteria bacterium]|nr:hypothetical protein [Acidobacteriota bacterium]